MKPKFFASEAAFRAWLQKNCATATELLVGFNKAKTDKGGLTYPQALDQALCFGWIDGVRKSLGEESYTIRFSPRKKGSYWSAVNIAKVKALQSKSSMHASGEAAFAERDETKTEKYSFERKTAQLDPAMEKIFRKNKKAWEFFEAQPPGYKKLMSFWVISAKKEETRQKRLAELIELSAKNKRHEALIPKKARS